MGVGEEVERKKKPPFFQVKNSIIKAPTQACASYRNSIYFALFGLRSGHALRSFHLLILSNVHGGHDSVGTVLLG